MAQCRQTVLYRKQAELSALGADDDSGPHFQEGTISVGGQSTVTVSGEGDPRGRAPCTGTRRVLLDGARDRLHPSTAYVRWNELRCGL